MCVKMGAVAQLTLWPEIHPSDNIPIKIIIIREYSNKLR